MVKVCVEQRKNLAASPTSRLSLPQVTCRGDYFIVVMGWTIRRGELGGGRRPFETRISAPVTPRAATKVYFLHSFSILSTPGVMYATANKHLDVLHTHILTLHFVSKNIRNISRCSELLFLLWFYPSLTLITIQLPLVSISAENTASPLAAPIISYTSLPLEEWEILFGA